MKEYRNFEELPLTLTAEDLKIVLNLSRSGVYQLLHRSDFPTITIGKRLLVPRESFLAWLAQNTKDGINE